MALPALTVVYLTFRAHPRFEWFVASLERELRDMPDYDRRDLQVVVIDGRHPRRLEASFPVECHAPKPTVWQGPHRLTQRDYFCAANARNTAFALARHDHVAFVDDLSVLLPGWLKAHVHAATHEYVLCGTTCKHKNIEVSADGVVVRSDEFPPGTDSRMQHLRSDDLVRCSGGWLYGGTFSVPLEHALRVNGQDEIHDTIGGEDYDFGARLERAGSAIYITRACGTLEDEDGHHAESPMVRLDKPWPPSNGVAPRTLSANGWSDSSEPCSVSDGPYSSNYLFHRTMRESARSWTLGNPFDLRALRSAVLAGEPFPIPDEPRLHWVDGQPLSEM
jgi:hypothetical protein